MKLTKKRMVEVPETVDIAPGYYKVSGLCFSEYLRVHTSNGKEVYDRVVVSEDYTSFICDFPTEIAPGHITGEITPCTEDEYMDAIGKVATVLENSLLRIERERMEKSEAHPRYLKPKRTNTEAELEEIENCVHGLK